MGDLFLPIIAHLRITGWRDSMRARLALAHAPRPPPGGK